MLSRLRDNPASALLTRILSAAVLAPPVLAAIYYGPPASDLLLVIAVSVMAWEWSHICAPEADRLVPAMAIAVAAIAVVLGGSVGVSVACWWLLFAVAGVGLLLGARPKLLEGGRPLWLLAGILYTALPGLALQWLRADGAAGRDLVIWLLAVVWATDSAAYLAGRTIGGPKIWPRVSPKKTWAGLVGGILAAAATGAVLGAVLAISSAGLLAVLAAVLAVLAQCGDFIESAVKRYFAVKDSSVLIPGHGGLLDRVDGLVTTAPFLAILVAFGRVI